MKKRNKIIYNVFKYTLGKLYKFWYNPTIIGSENIPSDGPIILAGNHVHIMDQCNVIISTKRTISYMAKKEYFDGIFSGFFRMVGCIPVDRSKKDNNAVNAAINVLNNNDALGIFPEGTRNMLKDERINELYEKYFNDYEYNLFSSKMKNIRTSQVNYLEKLYIDNKISKDDFKCNIFNCDSYLNDLVNKKIITKSNYYDSLLLPLKYGTVSLANKTNAYIIPFFVSGNYKFRSKDLVIRIGKKIKVSNDLELENKKLRKELISLINKE